MPASPPASPLERPSPSRARVPLDARAAGVLLHPTSLPGPHGAGDLGPPAARLIDFLVAAGQRWWQMLPVGPVGYGNSPYSTHSSFAGSPLLVSLEVLVQEGLLEARDLAPTPRFARREVEFAKVAAFREAGLRVAHARFAASRKTTQQRRELDEFAEASRGWLDDWTLYAAIKARHGGAPWPRWEPALRDRDPGALSSVRREMERDVDLHRFVQWQFWRQWRALRERAAAADVALLGDVPIFVAHDSADVWAHRGLFLLDDAGMPTVVAGVPPDYFSATGQRWGNPLYRWDVLADRGYDWWIDRLAIALGRFDAVRLDHFLGFVNHWEIPASEPNAVRGRWVRGPGVALFDALGAALLEGRSTRALPLVAEDLGVVTPEVTALRDRLGLPGLRILQFAFGDDPNAPDFKPHNYARRVVAYTGTHDNDTTLGWFHARGGHGSARTARQAAHERRSTLDYLGLDGKAAARSLHWAMIRALYASVADLVIVPMQDLLGLGSEARMNLPGTASGNWAWRMAQGAAGAKLASRLARLAGIYGRDEAGRADETARREANRR